MIERILLIMLTRSRPWNALEAIASVMNRASDPSMVQIIACIDEDDPQWMEMRCPNVMTRCESRLKFIPWLNYVAKHWISRCEWVGWLADDIRFRTTGWDDRLRAHKELVVYGDDRVHGEKLATHPFIRTQVPMGLGFFIPDCLEHQCADRFYMDLATELGSLAYDSSIITEHLHHTVGRSPKDSSYVESEALLEKDRESYKTLVRQKIPELAQRVREYLKI